MTQPRCGQIVARRGISNQGASTCSTLRFDTGTRPVSGHRYDARPPEKPDRAPAHAEQRPAPAARSSRRTHGTAHSSPRTANWASEKRSFRGRAKRDPPLRRQAGLPNAGAAPTAVRSTRTTASSSRPCVPVPATGTTTTPARRAASPHTARSAYRRAPDVARTEPTALHDSAQRPGRPSRPSAGRWRTAARDPTGMRHHSGNVQSSGAGRRCAGRCRDVTRMRQLQVSGEPSSFGSYHQPGPSGRIGTAWASATLIGNSTHQSCEPDTSEARRAVRTALPVDQPCLRIADLARLDVRLRQGNQRLLTVEKPTLDRIQGAVPAVHQSCRR
ncbi:hypothetical protein ACVWZD_001080 [Streptomyces sp. TE3672]